MHKILKKLMAGAVSLAITAGAAVSFIAPMQTCAVQVLGESAFEEKALPWHICEARPADQDFELEDGTFHILIREPIGAEQEKWDLQFIHRNLNFKKGHEYKLSFKVKGARAGMELCSYIGNLSGTQEYFVLDGYTNDMHMGPDMDGNWPLDAVNLTTDWQTFEGIFKPTKDLESLVWTFQYARGTNYQGNAESGDEIWFDDMSIDCLTCGDETQVGGCGWTEYNDYGIITPKSDVRLNQMGYYPNAVKKATYVTTEDKEAMEFKLVNEDGETVYRGKSEPAGLDKASMEYCHIIDFSAVKTPGTYTIVMDDEENVSAGDLTRESCKKYISHKFRIGDDIYNGVLGNALNYFYQNRSGSAIEEKFITSGDKKALAHEDVIRQDIAYVQSDYWRNWINPIYLNNDVELDVSGGWYQSEDYAKSVQYGGGAVWLLQNMYERSKAKGTDSKWADGKTMTVPDSYKVPGGNDINCKNTPDILDEARYELEFMFRMIVDPEKDTIWGEEAADLVYDSVVYSSQLPTPYIPLDYIDISYYSTPSRIVNPPSYAATLNMIACAAQASRLWKGIDDDFANECLSHAQKSWKAVMEHENAILACIRPEYKDPFYVPLGILYYDNFDLTDDAYWAACELYATTGDEEYYDYIKNCKNSSLSYNGKLIEGKNFAFDVPAYSESYNTDGVMTAFDSFSKTTCGSLSLYLSDKTPKDDKAVIKQNLLNTADAYVDFENDQNYMGIPYKEVSWYYAYDSTWPSNWGYDYGSNSRVTNNAVIMAYAYDATGDGKYINGAMQAMDYIFGRNGLGFSYVTGCGTYHVNSPVSEYWVYELDRNFPKAPDGVIVGGPCSQLYDDYVRLTGIESYKAPYQKSYADSVEAWSVNNTYPEWQASFAWIMDFFEDTGAKAQTTFVLKPTKTGDVNCDDEVDMADAVLIMQALANPNKYGEDGTAENHLTPQGKVNGDMNGDGLTVGDAQAIQRKLLGLENENSNTSAEA